MNKTATHKSQTPVTTNIKKYKGVPGPDTLNPVDLKIYYLGCNCADAQGNLHKFTANLLPKHDNYLLLLRKKEDMTIDEQHEYQYAVIQQKTSPALILAWLIRRQVDVFELIEKGLAIRQPAQNTQPQ